MPEADSEHVTKIIVLAGAGAANLEVLRRHIRQPLPKVRLIVISPRPTKILRDMFPWVISGEMRRTDAEVDLVKLCNLAGCDLILGEIDRIDPVQKFIEMKPRNQKSYAPKIFFDYLCLSIGLQNHLELTGENVVSGQRLEHLLERLDHVFSQTNQPKVAVFGDTPLAWLILRGLSRLRFDIEIIWLVPGCKVLPSLRSLERFRLKRILKKKRVKIVLNTKVIEMKNRNIQCVVESSNTDSSENRIEADLLIMSDEGRTPTLFQRSTFSLVDKKIKVNDALQLPDHKFIFVSGPSLSIHGHIVSFNPHKPYNNFGATVYENLRRELCKKPLIVFRSEWAFFSWLPSPPEIFSLHSSRRALGGFGQLKSSQSNERHSLSLVTLLSDQNGLSKVETLHCSQTGYFHLDVGFIFRCAFFQLLYKSLFSDSSKLSVTHANLFVTSHNRQHLQNLVEQLRAAKSETMDASHLEIRCCFSNRDLLLLTASGKMRRHEIKPGDKIVQVGKLGTYAALEQACSSSESGALWYQLRKDFGADGSDLILKCLSLGGLGGVALDNLGILRDLEAILSEYKVGASFDLDRLQVYGEVDASLTSKFNFEMAKFLPSEKNELLQYPRFNYLFEPEISGHLLFLPEAKSSAILEELNRLFPENKLSVVGAFISDPLQFRFRMTTRHLS